MVLAGAGHHRVHRLGWLLPLELAPVMAALVSADLVRAWVDRDCA